MDLAPESPIVLGTAFAIQTLVVFGANARVFGGKTNVEMADFYPTLITPAGYAFAIWGIIYTWEAVTMAYLFLGPMFLGPASDSLTSAVATFAPYWILANGCQCLWALAFAAEQLVGAGFLISGISVSLMLCIRALSQQTGPVFWLLVAPLSLHAGWVTAATLVGWNIALVGGGAKKALQIAIAFFSLNLAAAAAAVMLFSLHNVIFALAVAWALFAISVEVASSRGRKLITIDEETRAALAWLSSFLAYLLLFLAAALQGHLGWQFLHGFCMQAIKF